MAIKDWTRPRVRVGALVSALDEVGALGYAAVRRAVHLHIVIGRVGSAVGQRGGDQPQELVREFIGGGIADHRQVGLVGLEDVFDQGCGKVSQYKPCST